MRFLNLSLPILLLLSLNQIAHARSENRQMNHQVPNSRGNENSERPVDRIRANDPVYGGTGCPAGTMRVAFATDNLSFTILYDNMVAQIRSSAGERIANVTCNLEIPMTVPAGMQLSISRVDFRGFAGLPANVRAGIGAQLSYQQQNPRTGAFQPVGDMLNLSAPFYGPVNGDFVVSSGVMPRSTPSTSPCGGNVKLMVRGAIEIGARVPTDAQLTMDSLDGSTDAIYYLNWSRCGNGPNNSRDNGGRPPRYPGN